MPASQTGILMPVPLQDATSPCYRKTRRFHNPEPGADDPKHVPSPKKVSSHVKLSSSILHYGPAQAVQVSREKLIHLKLSTQLTTRKVFLYTSSLQVFISVQFQTPFLSILSWKIKLYLRILKTEEDVNHTLKISPGSCHSTTSLTSPIPIFID